MKRKHRIGLSRSGFPCSFDSEMISGWRQGDSNPRPLQCDCSALPTELCPRELSEYTERRAQGQTGSHGVDARGPGCYTPGSESQAGVTQLVECLLPKQNAVGSSPITRSPENPTESTKMAFSQGWPCLFPGQMCTKCVPVDAAKLGMTMRATPSKRVAPPY